MIPYYLPLDVLKASIVITDITGRIMHEVNIDANKTFVELDMINFTKGIYFYSLHIDGEIAGTKRMVVVK